MEEIFRFFLNNGSALFAILGTLSGGVVTYMGSWALSGREYNLRLWDKLLERRMKAHENLISSALQMRVMASLGIADNLGDIRRFPEIFISKDSFEDWFQRFTYLNNEYSTCLSIKAKRELYFFQDYLINLHAFLKQVPTENYPKVGEILRQDFIDLSVQLEKSSYAFFKKDFRKLKIGNIEEHHKYKKRITYARLSRMLLGQESVQRKVALLTMLHQ